MSFSNPLHGTCISLDNKGVLITGPSGSGKSDLALRLIDRGATLVGDDYVEIVPQAGDLIARPARGLEGMLEVRGIGLCRHHFLPEIRLALHVMLDEPPPRLPEPESSFLSGIALPILRLLAHEASAPIKVELALTQGVGIT